MDSTRSLRVMGITAHPYDETVICRACSDSPHLKASAHRSGSICSVAALTSREKSLH